MAWPKETEDDPLKLDVARAMFEQCMERITPRARFRLVSGASQWKAAAPHLRIGTACSGCDLAILGVDAIVSGLSRHTGLDLDWTHEFSCECHEEKAKFLATHFAAPIFQDLKRHQELPCGHPF